MTWIYKKLLKIYKGKLKYWIKIKMWKFDRKRTWIKENNRKVLRRSLKISNLCYDLYLFSYYLLKKLIKD